MKRIPEEVPVPTATIAPKTAPRITNTHQRFPRPFFQRCNGKRDPEHNNRADEPSPCENSEGSAGLPLPGAGPTSRTDAAGLRPHRP